MKFFTLAGLIFGAGLFGVGDAAESVTSAPITAAQPRLVDLGADKCIPCKMMAPEFAKAAAQTAGQAVFAKLNTEAVPEVGQRLRIQGIPAFILFHQGKEKDRSSGFQPAPQLLAWAASALAAGPR